VLELLYVLLFFLPPQLQTDAEPGAVVCQLPSQPLEPHTPGHFLCASELFQIGPAFTSSARASVSVNTSNSTAMSIRTGFIFNGGQSLLSLSL
jgi:hypothetical protein